VVLFMKMIFMSSYNSEVEYSKSLSSLFLIVSKLLTDSLFSSVLI